jgi:hypothetical protein
MLIASACMQFIYLCVPAQPIHITISKVPVTTCVLHRLQSHFQICFVAKAGITFTNSRQVITAFVHQHFLRSAVLLSSTLTA